MREFVLVAIILPISLYGNFTGMNSGARSLGMGNAYTALADDASGLFYNPAGIALNKSFNFIISKQNLYGVEDLSSDMLAFSLPTPIFRTAIGIQQVRLSNTYSEKIIYLTCAGIVRPVRVPVRFGVSVKNESVRVRSYEGARSPSRYDFDLGLIVSVGNNLSLGYSSSYILEPEFKLVNHSDKIKRRSTLGVNYTWRESVNFLADYLFAENESQWNIGSEIWFYNVFAARVGMQDENLTMGFGLSTNMWKVDGAMLAHTELGSTYRISLGWMMGGNK